MKKLGLIVNPIAGMGGRVGLKGTDGLEIAEQARKLGASPYAPWRTKEALQELLLYKNELELLACPGEMGETEAEVCGFNPQVVGNIKEKSTSPKDTELGAQEMLRSGVDLILFAGGDGTARDIFRAIGTRLPVLGIPAGVKIQSAAFAVTPRNAGRLALSYLTGEEKELKEVEVMDIDEQAFREGKLKANLYGYLLVPFENTMIQGTKIGAVDDEEASIEAAAECLIEKMEEDVCYIIGPGTSTRSLMEKLGLQCTLLGVDVICNWELIAADVNERKLLQLIDGREARIIVTVIGGQGFIFGRGNQQISPEIIKKVGKENIIILSSKNKIAALEERPLLVDTGDKKVDRMLEGYIKILTGYEEELIYRVNDFESKRGLI